GEQRDVREDRADALKILGRERFRGAPYASPGVMLKTRSRQPASPLTAIAAAIEPLRGSARDYDTLLELIGDARFVLTGEASHGTHEFYAERAAITKRLILEKDFSAVCIEGDWPDAYRVDCYLKNRSDDRSAVEALAGFKR